MSYQHNAYKAHSHMVRKTQQVVMLYDGAIRFCQQARVAIENGRIEDRFNALVKACDIITGLQLCLNFEEGGAVSKLLYDWYAGLDMRLLMVQQNDDIAMLDSCIDNLKVMREAWLDVDHKTEADAADTHAQVSMESGDRIEISESAIGEEHLAEVTEMADRAALTYDFRPRGAYAGNAMSNLGMRMGASGVAAMSADTAPINGLGVVA